MSRSYNSKHRKSLALKTKESILKKSFALFKKRGFDKVSIDTIAKEASVSPATIYNIFKSKRGILKELMDTALLKDTFEKLVKQSIEEEDPRKRLEISAKIARNIYDAERKQMDLLTGVSLIAPELKELEKKRETRRRARQQVTIDAMEKERSLAKELSVEKGRDILWALTGRDLYRMLVIEQNWNSNTYEEWLSKTLIESLTN